jgi:transcriptional regulator with XRE-family HTH domain
MFVLMNTKEKKSLIFAIVNTKEKQYFEVLGAKIKRLREEKSFEQKAFAFYCGLGRTQLYMIENGKTNPRLLTIMKIADGLEVTLSELLEIE